MPTDVPHLIPQPAELAVTGPGYRLDEDTVLRATAETTAVAQRLAEQLRRSTGLALPVAPTGTGIALTLEPELGPEAYRLAVSPSGVQIAGGDPAGVFYGTRTLLQLLPAAVLGTTVASAEWTVPGVAITDRPALGWRGSMLDVGRHFQPVEVVKRYIDLLALHKFNVLHWHLTEDQGWRVEIRRYPRLTEVGAWRHETLIGRPDRSQPANDRYDGVRHGGFYTQDEIRDVVRYAAERFVTVVPEIDVPGHSQAAIAAYPELGNTGEQLEVARSWGIIEHVLNVEESTVDFYRHVFAELFELFPSRFIHVGGDECPKTQWRESPRAQQRMRELGLTSEDQLQSWFIGQLDEFCTAHGRRLLGWDEILEGGLAPGATVMSWRGEEGGIAAAQAGHDVVMTPTSHVYFDYAQSTDAAAEPVGIGGHISLEQVYSYRPVPAALADAADRVLGSQFNLWTEYIATVEHLDYMAYPRACALAEVVWSPHRDSFAAFRERLQTHLGRLDVLGVAYRRLDPR